AGLRVPSVVTAGVADNGDALIVLRPDGQSMTADARLTAEQAAPLWTDLERLHSRGIVHRHLDLDRVVQRADGSAGFSDLSSASVRSQEADRFIDHAQLLALRSATCGKDVAIAQARSQLGEDELTATLPYVQDAVLPPMVRSSLHRQHIDVDAIRKAMVDRLQLQPVELVKIRRVTWKSM